MWVPLIRMVVTALSDPVIGVNAVIPQLPMDAGDTRPPKVKKIKGAVDDDGLLDEPIRIGPDFPVIAVRKGGPLSFRAEGERLILRQAVAPVLITYASGDKDDAEAARFGDWTQWAIMESLIQWLGRSSATAPRVRNQVEVVKLTVGETGAETGDFLEKAADGLITSATTVALTVKTTFLAT